MIITFTHFLAGLKIDVYALALEKLEPLRSYVASSTPLLKTEIEPLDRNLIWTEKLSGADPPAPSLYWTTRNGSSLESCT
jgi:hypothetical protein